MKINRKRFLKLAIVAFVIGLYPAGVLFYTWSCVFRSDFEGGRNGPLDAYRHTLASAVVSYTIGEKPVSWVTNFMESKGRNGNKMDRHNNRIGAQIGTSAKSFEELEPLVRRHVLEGAVDSSNVNQTTWLPKEKWRSARMW